MSSIACSAGFASCKTFGKQPKHPCFGAKPPYRSSAICATASCSGFMWLTASILAWTRGGSPSNIAPARMPGVYATRLCRTQSQPSIHSPSPRGRGLGFRQGCRYRTPKGFARTQSPQSVLKGIENSIFIKTNFFCKLILNFKLYSIFLHSVMKSEYDEHSEARKFE